MAEGMGKMATEQAGEIGKRQGMGGVMGKMAMARAMVQGKWLLDAR